MIFDTRIYVVIDTHVVSDTCILFVHHKLLLEIN